MTKIFARVLGLVFCLCLLAACGPKQHPVYRGIQSVRDMRDFPQDLTAYLRADRDVPILSAGEADAALEKWRTSFFKPWHITKPSIAARDVSLLLRRKARGWKNGDTRWRDEEWRAMRTNARMQTWPNVNKPGVTVRTTDLREMPTDVPRFSEPVPVPADNPFDYFQYSRLPMGLPVLLCQKTADGRWYYVETPIACGWVRARDLAVVDASFMEIWESATMVAVVRDGVDAGAGERIDIGVVLPAAGPDAVMVPVRKRNGTATMKSRQLAEGCVEYMPLVMTPASVANIGNQMLGQRYGWGGMLGLRDCSAMTRDLMTPFGIWLPRNSQAQGRTGKRISLSGLPSAAAREQVVLEKGVPFASLIVLKGHVVLYIGTWKGRPAILHDIWGIRVDEPEGEDNRLIIGRVVVTSMTPGWELPSLTNNSTIGDRFHTLTTLGGVSR